MKTLKIVALLIISFLFVVIGWSYLLGMSLDRTVFNLDYYEGLLEHEEIDLRSIVAGIIEEIEIEAQDELEDPEKEALVEEMVPEMDKLMHNIIFDAMEETIEVAWVEEQILLVVEDMLKLARGEAERLTVVIELSKLQEDFMQNLERRIEAVSEEELIAAGVPEENVEPVKAKFVEEFAEMTAESFNEDTDVVDLPGEIDLGEIMQEGELSPGFEEALARVQMFHTYFPVVHYGAFALILLLCCLLGGLWGGLKWFGASALITGVTYISGLFITQGLLFIPLLTEAIEDIPFGLDTIITAASYTVSRMYSPPLVYGGIGLIILIIAIIFGKRAERKYAGSSK